jgi:hypothetical protein
MENEALRQVAINLKAEAANLNDMAEHILRSLETEEQTVDRLAIGGGGIPNPTRPR